MLSLLGTIIAVAVVLEVIWIARHVLTWILIALFLALALNPAVEWFQRHGLKRRGAAAGVTFVLTLAFLALIGFLFVPTLVNQVTTSCKLDYTRDITHGRGRLGSSRRVPPPGAVRDAIKEGGATRVLGLSGSSPSPRA